MTILRLLTMAAVLTAVNLFAYQSASAKDQWTQVTSKNFFLIGNASEKDIRKVATRLEQFRETFRQLFGKMNLISPIQTNVVVFKSDSSYKNFKPKRGDGKIDNNVAGYFQPGEDVNYITLSTEGEDADTFGTIFHEYVHFIVSTNLGKSTVPPWFNEGLAEYYQTFEIIDDQKVKLGMPQGNHLMLLRQSDLMPLDQLFKVSNYQLHQTGNHSRSIFYAQSWALLHYLLQSGKTDGLTKFMSDLTAGMSPQKAFVNAFATEYAQMEKDLRKYVSKSQYQYNQITFKMKLLFDADMTAAPMSEADSNAYLGDLLYHTNRHDDAEPFLQAALKLEPDSSLGNTSLGMVKIRQRKFDEAKTYLEKAIAGDRKNHLAYYYYAFLLSRGAQDEFGMVYGLDKETGVKMREALKTAIAIAPTFTESYELLAFISLVSGEQLDEAVAALKTALKYQPGNQRYAMRIAEILVRQGKYGDAQSLAEKLVRTAEDDEIRGRAERLINGVSQQKEYAERSAAARKQWDSSPSDTLSPILTRGTKRPTEAELARREEIAKLRSINEVLRELPDGDKRVLGHIQKIDCSVRPIVYTVKTDSETFELTSLDFEGLSLNAYDPRSSNVQVGCDENISAYNAVLTYHADAAGKGKSRGELTVVEFVPEDFRFLSDEEMKTSLGEAYARPDENSPVREAAAGPPPPSRSSGTSSMMMEGLRNAMRKPAEGEKRDFGFLDRIECTGKGNFFYFRTATQTIRLFTTSPESLAIRLFAPDLVGLQFGCSIKPIEFPAVFVYKNKPDMKGKTAGELVAIDFVPKTFTLQ